jgi:hypothetical protein
MFEVLQTDRTVSAAATRGVRLSDAGAQTLDGLLAGTPTASHALVSYPTAQHAPLMAAVREGFISALGTTMELSFGLVVVGIVLTLLLIRSEKAIDPLPRPNMTEPFSGLAPRP